MPFSHAPAAFALTFLALSPVFGQDNYVNMWKSQVHLDRTGELDLTRTRKAVVLIADSPEPDVWDGFLRLGRPPLSKSKAAKLTLALVQGGPPDGICAEGDVLGPACAKGVEGMASGKDLTILLHGFRMDSTVAVPSPLPPSGANPADVQAAISGTPGAPFNVLGHGELRTTYRLSAEMILAETSTGRIYYRARQEADGTSSREANGQLARQSASRLSKLLDPEYRQSRKPNVLSIHPIGLTLTAATDHEIYQFSYERQLGEGAWALYWNPVLWINSDDTEDNAHHVHYLLMPFAGLRRYMTEEGRGLWLGAKAGYAYFEFIDKPLPLPGSFNSDWDTRWTKAHLGFAAAELGGTLALWRLRLNASVSAGMGLGWKKQVERDPTSGEPGTDEAGLGALPVGDVSIGFGFAF